LSWLAKTQGEALAGIRSLVAKVNHVGSYAPRVGVSVILIRDGKTLFGLRKGGHGAGTWAFPGGHLEFGESFYAAASREVMEETGIVIAPDQFRVVATTNDYFEDIPLHYVTVFLTAWLDVGKPGGEPKLLEPDKCSAWEWYVYAPEPLFLPIINLRKGRHLLIP
jgi:8-oxo-dGTP diphosphatase